MTYLLEIGTEELPAQDAWTAVKQLREKAPHILRSQGVEVSKDNLQVYATPRRLVVMVEGLSKAKINPTGLGKASVSLIKALKFEKSMRWLPEENLTFSRPIRWLVALLGDGVVDLEYAKVKSGRVSYGPRFLGSPEILIESADLYLTQLAEAQVIVDQEKRRAQITKQMEKLAAEVDGKPSQDNELLDEVVQLVEYPTAVRGEFDERFLKIPREVVVTVMKKHQRYFAVEDDSGKLLPYFITIANQLPPNAKRIAAGNEKVVEARLSDGEFFYQQDREHSLEHFVPETQKITFHEELGSVYDKSERLEKMASSLAEVFELDTPAMLQEAAHLCKADLTTAMVAEFSDLQGAVGRIYALEDGKEQAVSYAIEEHYYPRFSDDRLPKTKLDRVLAAADRIDTLVGFFAVGLKPTGSQDPYALRRAAIGLVQILVAMEKDVDLRELFKLADKFLPVQLEENELAQLTEFLQERMRVDLKEAGVADSVVRAVLGGPRAQEPYLVYKIARELNKRYNDENFQKFITAAKRVGSIVADQELVAKIDPQLFEAEAETRLYEGYQEADQKIGDSPSNAVVPIIERYYQLTEPINQYFEEVMVMTEDNDLRANRLALLSAVDKLFNRLFNSQSL